jgi:hypothetical protein
MPCSRSLSPLRDGVGVRPLMPPTSFYVYRFVNPLFDVPSI